MTIEIIKVQRPLTPDGTKPTDGPWMAYGNGSVRNVVLFEPDAAVAEAVGSDFKAYFNATWSGDGWLIRDRVPNQDW